MFNTYLPIVMHSEYGLKEYFANRDIEFGMAGEYSSFDSSVQYPLIHRHAATFTTEVSIKMAYTQATRGVWDFSYADKTIARAKADGKKVHGHCAVWHIQNPPWLEPTLETVSLDEGYNILEEHVMNTVSHFAPQCDSMDIVNEYGAVMDGYGWGKYLGNTVAPYAMDIANKYKGDCKLYYNSFFDSDIDANFAINMLPYVDGIGVQLHLAVAKDYRDKLDRIARVLQACKDVGKPARFSECTVLKGVDGTMEDVARVWRDIVRFALGWGGTVINVTQWGVKYPAWGYRHVLFDDKGLPTIAYDAVVEELKG